MELMASGIAKLIKDQDAQGKHVALIPRDCVRTVCANALGVGREVTAKEIATMVKRGPSMTLAAKAADRFGSSLRVPSIQQGWPLCISPIYSDGRRGGAKYDRA